VAGKDVVMSKTLSVPAAAKTGVYSLRIEMTDSGNRTGRGESRDCVNVTSGKSLEVMVRGVRMVGRGEIGIEVEASEAACVELRMRAVWRQQTLARWVGKVEEGENRIVLRVGKRGRLMNGGEVMVRGLGRMVWIEVEARTEDGRRYVRKIPLANILTR